MDRRNFLQLLGTVGVLSGAASLIHKPVLKIIEEMGLPPPKDLMPWLDVEDLAVQGRTQELFRLDAFNNTDTFAEVYLQRFEGQVIQRFLVPARGYMQWQADPLSIILGPVKIVTPERLQIQVQGRDSQGRVVIANKNGEVHFLSP